jgi:hypothetical protein
VRVAEEHVDAGIDAELTVLGHLATLVPGNRAPQRCRQRLDRGGHCVADFVVGATVREMQPNGVPRSGRQNRGGRERENIAQVLQV